MVVSVTNGFSLLHDRTRRGPEKASIPEKGRRADSARWHPKVAPKIISIILSDCGVGSDLLSYYCIVLAKDENLFAPFRSSPIISALGSKTGTKRVKNQESRSSRVGDRYQGVGFVGDSVISTLVSKPPPSRPTDAKIHFHLAAFYWTTDTLSWLLPGLPSNSGRRHPQGNRLHVTSIIFYLLMRTFFVTRPGKPGRQIPASFTGKVWANHELL
ncbi:hypothetical protein F5X98DRAFT_59568 [Xylaria grammica]|nr:hypothetical protein F5X98DRAFT_59568 [Xylaria grammica]